MNKVVQAWNALDWSLAAILLFSVLAGLIRGLIRTLFGLAGLVCGFAVAAWQHGNLAAWLVSRGWITSMQIADPLSYVAVAFAVMVLFGIIGAIVRRSAHAVGLGPVDRLCGGALGAIRSALIGAVIVSVINSIAPHSRLMRNSQLSSYFLSGAHAIIFLVPHSLRWL